jgi:hypothetical protein
MRDLAPLPLVPPVVPDGILPAAVVAPLDFDARSAETTRDENHSIATDPRHRVVDAHPNAVTDLTIATRHRCPRYQTFPAFAGRYNTQPTPQTKHSIEPPITSTISSADSTSGAYSITAPRPPDETTR